MSDTYNKDLCDEKHKPLTALQADIATIKTDIATIKTTLSEREKQQTVFWKLLPFVLALLAGGGGGAVVAARTINQSAQQIQTQIDQVPAPIPAP